MKRTKSNLFFNKIEKFYNNDFTVKNQNNHKVKIFN